jgi:hypothetical protein
MFGWAQILLQLIEMYLINYGNHKYEVQMVLEIANSLKVIFSTNSQPLSSVKTFPFISSKQHSSILLTTANH